MIPSEEFIRHQPRRLIGHILPDVYYAERDEIEAVLLALSREADAKEMQELSIAAVEKD